MTAMAFPNLSTLLASVLLLSSPVSVSAGTTSNDYHDPYAQTLNWTDCTAASGANVTIQCASLTIPLDWTRPNGTTISIAVNRRLCTGNSTCKGPLVYNPGGPAASGLTAVSNDQGYFSEALKSHFDIVGVDPRGVGRSTPIQCDPNLYNTRYPTWPQNKTQTAQLMHHNAALAQSCLSLSGDIVKHIDTASVARDLDVLRSALGMEKLNFFSLSYGTMLATTYIASFPSNVGSFALDAILDHSAVGETAALVEETIAREKEFVRFTEWCNETTTCALHDQDVGALFSSLIDNANTHPIPAPACKTSCRTNVTGDEILVQMNKFLHLKATWPDLATSIQQALSGNATLLSPALALTQNSTSFAAQAIACLDWTHSNRGYDDWHYQQLLTRSIAPYTRGVTGMHQFMTWCAGWPWPVEFPQKDLDLGRNGSSLPSVLLVNALHDPQTSYAWAVNVRRQIPGAVLVTREGDGHGSYGLHGEAAGVVDKFFIEGKLPEQGKIVQT